MKHNEQVINIKLNRNTVQGINVGQSRDMFSHLTCIN